MVSTADGKILLGPPGSTAIGLGSPTDQMLMRRIQTHADAAILGAGTLRPGNVVYDPAKWRAVITRSGDIPLTNRFFTDAPDKALVFAPETLPAADEARLSSVAKVYRVGDETVDVTRVVTILRNEYSVHQLVLEGGASLNFDFFAAGLVDELFLTLAPKLKGGVQQPTIVDGAGFPGQEHLRLQVLSLYHDGDEFYFRYRIGERA
jgi:riboflavin biosynthesis pyrimidine reductase